MRVPHPLFVSAVFPSLLYVVVDMCEAEVVDVSGVEVELGESHRGENAQTLGAGVMDVRGEGVELSESHRGENAQGARVIDVCGAGVELVKSHRGKEACVGYGS